MTSNQIISLSRKKMLETTDDILDDATIELYLNEANIDLRIRLFPNNAIKTATISFTNGVGTLPTDFGTLYGDPYAVNSSSEIYPEVSINDFSREVQNRMVTIEGGIIKIAPNTTGSVVIKYYPNFETLDTVQNPTLPAYFHELYIYGILYRAFEDLQDEALSKYYSEKYEEMLMAKSANYSNYEEGNQRGGVLFNGIDMIGDGGNGGGPNFF